MRIHLIDVQNQLADLREDMRRAIDQVLEDGQFILGPNVRALEEEMASLCGAAEAVGVANGTDALVLLLRSLGVGPGDEVITAPYTFYATAEAISAVGATPVFADIDPASMNIDPRRIEEKISKRTKAVMPVHLFGQPAEMDEVLAAASRHGLPVIEDACQAVGGSYRGKPVGSLAAGAAFSFFPTKNLSCLGDGGMVTTNDPELAERVRLLRFHGSRDKVEYFEVGYNSRLDEVQAAVLRAKLPRLKGWTERRREIAKGYGRLLEGLVELPRELPERTHVYHLYVIRSPERERIRQALLEREIGASVYYGTPLHLQPVYRSLGYEKGDLPEAERAAREGLAIPMHPYLRDSEIEEVCSVISGALAKQPA